MLVLDRKDGQWIDVTHRSGDVLRIKIYGLLPAPGEARGRCRVALDDDPHNFQITRREARRRPGDVAAPALADAASP